MARERALRVDKREAKSGPVAQSKPKNERRPRPSPPSHRPLVQIQLRLVERARRVWERAKRLSPPLRAKGAVIMRAGSVLLAVAAAVAAGRLVQHHLTTAPAFAIDTVEVGGLARIQRAELLEAAGIREGTNVFEKSPEEVRSRLLRHPWIASASVSRRLPRRVDIEVREREPVALLVVEACAQTSEMTSQDPACDDPSLLYLVSDEGTVFKRLEGQDPVDLPVITGIDRQRLATEREAQPRVLREAVTLLSEYRSVGLWNKLTIGEIHVERGDAFSLYVGDELTHVRLGAPPFGQKLRRMKKVFDRLSREKASAEYVYLDNERRPDRVTVRLR